jgi:hypothetical protein
MMIVQADLWLGLPWRGILRTGLGHREWTMQTLGVVRAYVGFSLPSCPFPLACEVSRHKKIPKKNSTIADHKFTRRLVLYAATGIACANNEQHTPDAAPGSEGGVFADTKYVGLFGPTSFSCVLAACPYRALQTWFDASPCGVEGHLGHQDAPVHIRTSHSAL